MARSIKLRTAILSFTAIIDSLLIIRFVLDILKLQSNQGVIGIFVDITNFLTKPFEGSFETSKYENVNFDYLAAALFYTLIGFIFSEIIFALIVKSIKLVIIKIVDAFFKIIETFFFLRLVLDFFQIDTDSSLLDFINSTTNWASDLINLDNFLDGRLNLSIFVFLVIIIILDIFTESFLNSLLDYIFPEDEHKVEKTFSNMERNSNVTNYFNISPVEQRPVNNIPAQVKQSQNLPQPQQIHVRNDLASYRTDTHYQNKNQESIWSRFKRLFRS